MKIGSKIALLMIITVISLGVVAVFIYDASFELQNSLPKINKSIKEAQNTYDSTIQLANLKDNISDAMFAMAFGLSNDSTSNQNLFDTSISKALLTINGISSSNEASQISYDLKKLKDVGDLAFAQNATLVSYQNHLKTIQSNLSNAKDRYVQVESQISNLMTLNKTIVSTVETSFTTIVASANDLSLSATKSQLVQKKLEAQISALPVSELNIADTEKLLDNVALLIGTSEAQNMVSSMKLALKNIYLATSQNSVDTQLVLIKTYIQSLKTEMNMGALNSTGIFYANLLLDRYYFLSQQLGALVMKAQNNLSEVQSISASADNYNQKISNQRDLIINSITVNAKKYFNSINVNLSSLFERSNSNTKNALANAYISSDPISNTFDYLVTITLIIASVAIACVIVFGIFLIFDFKRNFENLEKIVDEVKTGDLNKIEETNRKDEFGNLENSFHKMIDYLKETFVHLKQTTSSMKADLQNINSMEDKSSLGIKETRADVDKSKNLAKESLEELKEMIQKLSKIDESERSAMNKIEILDKSSDNSEKALFNLQKEVDNLVSELSAAKDEIIKKSKYVEDLKASYNSISNLAETLDSIARQSNTLALNVAIKSAKTGSNEFAFLESEMKTLANESIIVSKEIKVETKALEVKIEKAVLEMETSVASMEHLSDAGEKTIDMIKNVSTIFDRTMKDVKEMAETMGSNDAERSQIDQIFQEKVKLLEEAIPLLDSISRSLNESKNVMADITDLTKKMESALEILDENAKKFKTE